MEPGVYYDMSFAEYAAAPGLNASKIVYMRRSPMHYRWMLDHPMPETDATKIGTLVHRMVLEPSLIENIAVWGRLSEQKVRRGHTWDEFCKAHASQQILTVAESETTTRMARAALTQAPIRKYAMAEGPTEVSMFWIDERTGLFMKARLDKIVRQPWTIVDLKSCVDSRPHEFGATCHRFAYVVKMAHYFDGFRTVFGHEPEMKLLALEKPAPHESAVYDIPRDLTMCGLDERNSLIDRIIECEKSHYWPAAEQDERFLELPSWAAYDMADSEMELVA